MSKPTSMVLWALAFFAIALIATGLGFREIAGLSARIGYLLLVVAVIFFVLTMFLSRARAGSPAATFGGGPARRFAEVRAV